MMKKLWVILLCLLSSACSDTSDIGEIVLTRNGEIKKVSVNKIGARCYVAWYASIEKLILRRDGFVINYPFTYKWTLVRSGPDNREEDIAWYNQHCWESEQ
jgi:hypothetical protein